MNASSSPMPARTGAPAPTTTGATPASASTAGAATTAARTSTTASLPPVPTAPPASTGWLLSPAFVQRERQVRVQSMQLPQGVLPGVYCWKRCVCFVRFVCEQRAVQALYAGVKTQKPGSFALSVLSGTDPSRGTLLLT